MWHLASIETGKLDLTVDQAPFGAIAVRFCVGAFFI